MASCALQFGKKGRISPGGKAPRDSEPVRLPYVVAAYPTTFRSKKETSLPERIKKC